jgi:hypothetical protein
MLGSDLLKGKVWEVRAFSSVLDRNSADASTSIDVELRVLVQISRLSDVADTEFNVQRIGVLEVLDLHAVKERSKNALCTVSPSASNTTEDTDLPSLGSVPNGESDRPPESPPSLGAG